MPQAIRWKLLPLAFVLALGAAACSEPPTATVNLGTGVRFLPEVGDSLNDAGRYPSIVTNPDGLPVVAYFGFEEELEAGAVPVTRPVGSPSIPGVLLATVSQQGFWTRGAIAMQAEIPNVSIAFNPAFEPSVTDLTPENVTGLAMVADGDTYHAVWGSDAGLYYATGSLDPATTTQAVVTQVTKTPGYGLSIGLAGGNPAIAFYTSTSSDAKVQLATPNGDTWSNDTIAEAAGCDTCRTAVIGGDRPSVAYSKGGAGVEVASNDGENGFVSFDVSATGGQGLSGVAMDGGLALSYYDAANGQVTIATRTGDGSVDTVAAAEVPEGSAEGPGARTGIALGSERFGRPHLVGRRRRGPVRDRRPGFAEGRRHGDLDGGRGVPDDHRERGRLGHLPRVVRDHGGRTCSSAGTGTSRTCRSPSRAPRPPARSPRRRLRPQNAPRS